MPYSGQTQQQAPLTSTHPRFVSSHGFAVSGAHQVGYGSPTPNVYHALLWSGTAASYVDLNPPGFYYSDAADISGDWVVGRGIPTGTGGHALLWSVTEESYVDLNPEGFLHSEATGVGDAQQVGRAWKISSLVDQHAMLWYGTAESCIDLNPPGFDISGAQAVSNGYQVGSGYGPVTGNMGHALRWSGTAESYLDLHQYLPAGYVSSTAMDIDAFGNIVGYARTDGGGAPHAVLWQVPAPGALLLGLLGLGAAGLKLRRFA